MQRRSETLGDDVWKTDPSREPHMALRMHRYTHPTPIADSIGLDGISQGPK